MMVFVLCDCVVGRREYWEIWAIKLVLYLAWATRRFETDDHGDVDLWS